MLFSKGQQEIVTTVLIFGVVISLVGATYMWGVPLIQKQQAFGNIQRAENFMKDLGEKISKIDKGEDNTKDIMTITEDGVLSVNPTENTIEFTTVQKGTYYIISNGTSTELNEKWTPVEWGPEGKGIFGKDKPYIIRAKAIASGDNYEITYQIKFRELMIKDSENTYLINITTNDDNFQDSGVTGDQIHIENNGRIVTGTKTVSEIIITIP